MPHRSSPHLTRQERLDIEHDTRPQVDYTAMIREHEARGLKGPIPVYHSTSKPPHH